MSMKTGLCEDGYCNGNEINIKNQINAFRGNEKFIILSNEIPYNDEQIVIHHQRRQHQTAINAKYVNTQFSYQQFYYYDIFSAMIGHIPRNYQPTNDYFLFKIPVKIIDIVTFQ
ncbi:hypothetical protein GQX74_001006 [Glossina fuscipes]|nr:hypothetical protein GQX74_001006 [Glossina fuscipes]